MAAMYDAVALAGRGCGLVATTDIPAGTVVLQEDPVLVYTTHAARGAVCAACLRLVGAAQAAACACPDCGALRVGCGSLVVSLRSVAAALVCCRGGRRGGRAPCGVIAVSGVCEKRDVDVGLAGFGVCGGVGRLLVFTAEPPRKRAREGE